MTFLTFEFSKVSLREWFQLFVPQSVCLFVNTITQERLTVLAPKFAYTFIMVGTRSSSILKSLAQKLLPIWPKGLAELKVLDLKRPMIWSKKVSKSTNSLEIWYVHWLTCTILTCQVWSSQFQTMPTALQKTVAIWTFGPRAPLGSANELMVCNERVYFKFEIWIEPIQRLRPVKSEASSS